VAYYNNPSLYKIEDTPDQAFSVYGVRFQCLLHTPRYLVAVIPVDTHATGTPRPLRDLAHWCSLQTRTVRPTDTSNLGPSLAAHAPLPHSARRFAALATAPILFRDKDHRESRYDCPALGLRVTLLHPSPHEDPGYRAEGTVLSALESYQTVITRYPV
jgi:hypothetical protein